MTTTEGAATGRDEAPEPERPPVAAEPPGPRGWRGNARAARDLLSEPTVPLGRLAAAHGPTFQVRLGPKRLVVVGDPAHVHDVLRADRAAFRWRRVFRNLAVVVGRTSVLVSDGDDHRRRRGAVQPAFARRRLDGWVPLVVAEADRLIDEVTAAGPAEADLYGLGRRLVRRVVVRVLFGADLGERADTIGDVLEPAMRYATEPVLRQLPHPLPFTPRARARAARRAVHRLLADEMDRRRARGRDPAAPDLLDALLAEGGLSDRELRDQVVTLVGAGYDTTAATLSWLLVRSVATPGVWERLRAEADAVLDPAPAPVDADRFRALRWADAVVHETLRLHPAGAFAPREATQVVQVGPYRLRPGSLVLWSPYLMGRHPDWWDDPLAFRPERHLDRQGPARPAGHDELAWAPFGRGFRACLGFALAQMELTLIAARFAQRLDVRLASDRIPAATGIVVSRPAGGVPCRLARRRIGA